MRSGHCRPSVLSADWLRLAGGDVQSTATLTRLLPPNVTFQSQKASAAMCSPISPAITGPKPIHGS